MNMKIIAALGAVVFLAAEANAGGMPPEFEIDANGLPLDTFEPAAAVIEPAATVIKPMATAIESEATIAAAVETITTAAVDDLAPESAAAPAELPLARALLAAPAVEREHR